MEATMFFEVTRISNGWEIKGAWTDPGGQAFSLNGQKTDLMQLLWHCKKS
jgi:hypothetical protein